MGQRSFAYLGFRAPVIAPRRAAATGGKTVFTSARSVPVPPEHRVQGTPDIIIIPAQSQSLFVPHCLVPE